MTLKRLSLFLLLVFLFNCREFQYKKLKSPLIKGAVVAHVHNSQKGYGSGTSQKLYSYLKKIGYTSIQLNTFAYQNNLNDIRLSWEDPTLTLKDLEKEIRLIHSQGMQVMLKPHIWITNRDWKSPGIWRSGINYSDKEKLSRWFREYERFISEQVKAAIRNDVEIFVVGTELVKLSRHTKYWRSLIKKIRAQGYRGALTYACEAWNAKHISFWDDLDYIGLDFYYGLKEENPSEEELTEFYSEKLLKHIRHAQNYSLPILFTEVGFPSHQYAIQKPALWRKSDLSPRDDLQTLTYRNLRKAMEKTSYPHGVWFWKYVTTLNSYERSNHSTGFILQEKPAEEEIKKMLRPQHKYKKSIKNVDKLN